MCVSFLQEISGVSDFLGIERDTKLSHYPSCRDKIDYYPCHLELHFSNMSK